MAHHAAGVTVVKPPTKSFGKGIGHVDDACNMLHENITISAPFLNGKVLDIDLWVWIMRMAA
jgi:hypothetical protein